MNHHFKSWTRNVAFCLTLHQNAIGEILDMYEFEKDCKAHERNPRDFGSTLDRGDGSYLERRGLAVMCENGNYALTRAGELTCELLMEAGFEAPHAGASSIFHEPWSELQTA